MENNVDAEYPFTGDEYWDRVVEAFYIIRGVSFAVLFILNAIQTYFEFLSLKRKARSPSPRFFTFVSITLFPLCRAIQSFLSAGLKDTRTGSASWYLGIWGTLFLSTEWLFIGCFWARLLYTFFSSKKIALGNIKKTWYSAWFIVVILFCWNIVLMVMVNFKNRTFTASVSGKGFISLVALIGTFLVVNGFFLIKNLKSQDKKSNTFRQTIKRTIRLSLQLLVLVIGLIIREIVVAITKISVDSNYRYAAIFVTFFLEFPQCIVVMNALADDGIHWKNYFLFAKVAKDSNSSASSLQGESSGSGRQQNSEIDLNSFVVDNESSTPSKKSGSQFNLHRESSKAPIAENDKNSTVSITISTNQNNIDDDKNGVETNV